ncbi:MAG: hypothetical protein PHV34_04390 [Verrucomicrobiae bacterium]|nr:hypothetical protein [Verrucomicrobiae bacterium]
MVGTPAAWRGGLTGKALAGQGDEEGFGEGRGMVEGVAPFQIFMTLVVAGAL